MTRKEERQKADVSDCDREVTDLQVEDETLKGATLDTDPVLEMVQENKTVNCIHSRAET